jgi:Acetyltransferase (GNAT) domain
MWTEYTGSDFEWDRIVASFSNAHPTHQYHWTVPPRNPDTVRRLLFIPVQTETPTAAIQFLHKKMRWGLHYFRSDGGLAGNHSALAELPLWLKTNIGCKFWYLRVFSRVTQTPSDVAQFRLAKFSPVKVKIHAGVSAKISLASPYCATYSGNWKHNLARALKKKLVVSFSETPPIEALMSIFKELETAKNIGNQFAENELRHLMSAFGPNLIVASVKSSSGELLSVRAALLLGTKAFDLLAVTSDAGRTQYASNLAFHALLEKCASEGVTFYDCAGIDQVNGKGVMQFKMGAGGEIFDYGGEWELASKNYIRAGVSALMKVKLSRNKN